MKGQGEGPGAGGRSPHHMLPSTPASLKGEALVIEHEVQGLQVVPACRRTAAGCTSGSKRLCWDGRIQDVQHCVSWERTRGVT